MDIPSRLIRNLFYPMWMVKDGNKGVLPYLNHFDFIDNLDRTELAERQASRLKCILIHAYENTAYYRNLFDKVGFNPHEIVHTSEIRKLPLLTKDIVRRHFNDLTAHNIRRELITEASTGGSTGVPMRFLRDRESIYLRKGQELYFDRWMGYEIGNKVALFVAASHFDGVIEHLKAQARNATCERMLNFDPHNITDHYMASFMTKYKKFNPSMIKCFPNSLIVFADFIKRKGVQLSPVRSISCTGENLYEHQRKLFQDTFGGEVFEKVGTRESGVFACECHLHKGLHVFTEGVFLEILNSHGQPAQPGEIGKVIITDLFNRSMPLIRYDIGDMAIASDGRICDCGNPLPLIEKLLGRDRDIILDSYGNPKPGYLFAEVILDMNLSAQFQVVQPDKGSLWVKIVKKDAEPIDTRKLQEAFQGIVGPFVTIEFEFVNEIPRDPSGKYGYVVSRLTQSGRY